MSIKKVSPSKAMSLLTSILDVCRMLNKKFHLTTSRLLMEPPVTTRVGGSVLMESVCLLAVMETSAATLR